MKTAISILKVCAILCLAAWLLHCAVCLVKDIWWMLAIMAGIALGAALLIRSLRNRRW